MIAGVLNPQKGAIRFAGRLLTGLPSHDVVRRGITLVPEGRLVFPQMTVMENLQLARTSSSAVRSAHWSTGLRAVSASRRAAQPARRLDERWQAADAGDRARPDAEPRLVILDEPSLGLMRSSRRRSSS